MTKQVIWFKNKDSLEIIGELNEVSTSTLTAEVAKFLMKNLKEDINYGAVDVKNIFVDFDQDQTIHLSKTEVANVLQSMVNVILSLSFNKKDGSARIITGFADGNKDPFGRYYFHEITEDEVQIRLVDPRELNWVRLPSKWSAFDAKSNLVSKNFHVRYIAKN